MSNTWEDIQRQISTEIPKNTFSLWIKPINLVETTGERLVLACPNKFSRDWVMENYLSLIRERINLVAGSPVDVVLKIQEPPKTAATWAPSDLSEPRQLTFSSMPGNGGTLKRQLNQKFTFDRFIVGNSNEFAYSASKALANGSHCDYDTLFMLSGTGLGKTHLAQAVGHSVLENNPQTRVRYVTAEDFTNEMISSLKNNAIDAFKKKYRRSCDVLLLEEVHFLSGKEKTQLELEYTLDALINERKKIVFTSALPPKNIPRLSKSLSSRLVSGLVTTISPPDHETRAMIIARKAAELNMSLPDDIIDHLASRLIRDVRQMESALKCLKAKSDLLKARIDRDLTEGVLDSLADAESSITPAHIRKLICTYYKADPETLGSKSRKKVHAYPRNVYVYLCRRHTDCTLAGIGKTINRTHSAVLYATELVAHKMKTENELKQQVRFLNRKLDEMKHAE